MIDENGDKIITKKECDNAAFFDWVDSEVFGDPSHPLGACARDVAQCKLYCKLWNEVYQRYFSTVTLDIDCELGSIGFPSSLPTEN